MEPEELQRKLEEYLETRRAQNADELAKLYVSAVVFLFDLCCFVLFFAERLGMCCAVLWGLSLFLIEFLLLLLFHYLTTTTSIIIIIIIC